MKAESALRAFKHSVWMAAHKYCEAIGVIATPADLDHVVDDAVVALPVLIQDDDGPDQAEAGK